MQYDQRLLQGIIALIIIKILFSIHVSNNGLCCCFKSVFTDPLECQP